MIVLTTIQSARTMAQAAMSGSNCCGITQSAFFRTRLSFSTTTVSRVVDSQRRLSRSSVVVVRQSSHRPFLLGYSSSAPFSTASASYSLSSRRCISTSCRMNWNGTTPSTFRSSFSTVQSPLGLPFFLNAANPLSARQPQHRRSFSSTTTTTTTMTNKNPMDHMVLGAHQWSRLDPNVYTTIVRTALENGVRTFEVGQERGVFALTNALRTAFTENPSLLEDRSNPITLLYRIGYRTVMVPPPDDDDKTNQSNSQFQAMLGDVFVEEQQMSSQHDGGVVRVVHNLSPAHLRQALTVSNFPNPLLDLQKDFGGKSLIQITAMLHNPETQAFNASSSSSDPPQDTIQEALTTAFGVLQELVDTKHPDADVGITSFGIVSNGLNLPPDHPLHLSPTTIVNALSGSQQKSSSQQQLKFTVIQLPFNLLESQGRMTAKTLKEQPAAAGDANLPPFDIYAMRPLSCYPDLGTGTGHPFLLVDYLLPAGTEKPDPMTAAAAADGNQGLVWSNTMTQPPPVYDMALKMAMSHFDASELIEKKIQGGGDQALTTEERETLDGCKLLQSLLHDVDVGLDQLRSFAAHEQELFTKIIPLIHETFEGYDEDTARVLTSFFGAYSLAVRYAIARNTRTLLTQGEETKLLKQANSGNAVMPVFPELPQDRRLQEFGLQYVLDEPAVDKVVVGAMEPDHVLDNIQLFYKLLEEKEAAAAAKKDPPEP